MNCERCTALEELICDKLTQIKGLETKCENQKQCVRMQEERIKELEDVLGMAKECINRSLITYVKTDGYPAEMVESNVRIISERGGVIAYYADTVDAIRKAL